jgi:hypothetical protein
MRRQRLARLALSLLVAALPAAFFPAGAGADEAAPPTASDSRAQRSNLPDGMAPWWPSRYGADDVIGSLNELTPDRIQTAARLIRTGRVVSLGRILDEHAPVFPGRYWRQTVDLTPHVANLRRPDAHGQGWGRNEINWITEIQAGTFQVGTQLDSIGHIQIGDRFYNGWRVRDVVESSGLNRFGMESVPPIIGRGVLVDLAGARGVERLARGTVVTVADVEAALAHRLGRPVGRGQRRLPRRRTRPRPGTDRMAACQAHRRRWRRHLEHRPGTRRRPGAAVPGAANHVRPPRPVRLREPGDGRTRTAGRCRVPVHQHARAHAGLDRGVRSTGRRVLS